MAGGRRGRQRGDVRHAKQGKESAYHSWLTDGGGATWERMQGALKAESKPWLVARKEMRNLVLQMQKPDSANNHNKLGNGFFLRASREEPSWANTLALCDPDREPS